MADGFDRQEFENIYRMYYKRMFGLCMKYVADAAAAEDLVQDSFVVVLTKIDTLKDKSKLEKWMFSIARNTCLKYVEKKKLFEGITVKDEINAGLSDSENGNEKPQIAYDDLMQMVERLPEGSKKVFKLYTFDGLSHNQIAKQLNISAKTSSSQLHRAKKALQSMIHSYWTLCAAGVVLIAATVFSFFHGNTDTYVSKPPQQSGYTTVAQEQIPVKFETTDKQKNLSGCNFAAFTQNSVDNTQNQDVTLQDTVIKSENTAEKIQDTLIKSENKIKPPQKTEDVLQKTYAERTKKQSRWALRADFNAEAYGNMPTDYDNIIDIGGFPSFAGRMPGFMPGESGFYAAKTKYHLPVTLSVMLEKPINGKFSAQCGFNYTYMKTEFMSYSDALLTYRLQYAGIRLAVAYHCTANRFLNVYTSAGIGFEVPVYDKAELYAEGKTVKSDLNAADQVSLGVALGVECRITDRAGIFIEPQVVYFFDNGDKVQSYRKQHKLCAELPVGIRIKF